MKKYRVTLTDDERASLAGLIAAGQAAALKLARARILLKADAAPGGPSGAGLYRAATEAIRPGAWAAPGPCWGTPVASRLT